MQIRIAAVAAFIVGFVAVPTFAKPAPVRYTGVRAKIRVAPVTLQQCEEYMHSGKCRGALVNYLHPKCKAVPGAFSAGVNLLLEIDGQPIKTPSVFYASMGEEGPHSIKLYWYEKDPDSAAFLSGIRKIQFDLAQCR